MGSGSSRGKKVAPAFVSEVNGSNGRDNTVGSLKRDGDSFKPVNIPKFSNSVTQAPSDCHDSEFSAGEDDLDAELNRVIEEYGDEEVTSKAKSTPKMSFIRSKTYGICAFKRVRSDKDLHSTSQMPKSETSQEPCGRTDSEQVNNEKSNSVFCRSSKHTTVCHNNHQNGLLTKAPCGEPVPRPEKDSSLGECHSPFLALPVIQYDGSEEELMDTIEREFS